MPVVKKIIATSPDDFATGEAGPDTASVSPGTAAALKAIERNIAAQGEFSAAINRLDTASRQASSALVTTGMPAAAMAEPLPDPVTLEQLDARVTALEAQPEPATWAGEALSLAQKLKSRKLWVTIAAAISAVVLALQGAHGEFAAVAVVVLGVIYNVIQGSIDNTATKAANVMSLYEKTRAK